VLGRSSKNSELNSGFRDIERKKKRVNEWLGRGQSLRKHTTVSQLVRDKSL